MNNNDLKLYVDDAMKTLTALSIDFITIIRHIEANQKDKNFIISNSNTIHSSYQESKFIDEILIEYLCVNILSVFDTKQFNKELKREKDILNYDILKLARRISGNEGSLNAKEFRITKVKEVHKKIDYKKLLEIKNLRDQHYSHIDRRRKDDTGMYVLDIIEITKSFLKMFDLIHKAINNTSIFETPSNLQLFDLKLKTFKYDAMMKYLNDSKNPDLNNSRYHPTNCVS